MNNFLMDVYLGLGTNMGNKRKNLLTAAALLAERAGDVLAISMKQNRGGFGQKTHS